MVFPTQIDITNAIRVGHVSNRTEERGRWIELAVYWLNDPQYRRKQWLAEWLHCSVIEGEVEKRSVHQGGTLESAMRLFHDTNMGREVATQAYQWREENAEMINAFYQENRKSDPGKVQG
jgi:hypothetical protein